MKKNENENLDGFEVFESEAEGENESEAEITDGVEVKYYVQQKSVVHKVMCEYINNVESRFEETDIVQKMQVSVPSSIVGVSTGSNGELSKYGSKEIVALAEHFSTQGIDKQECSVEYRQYKRLVVGSSPESKMATMCAVIKLCFFDVSMYKPLDNSD